jgi:hypothetical protein
MCLLINMVICLATPIGIAEFFKRTNASLDVSKVSYCDCDVNDWFCIQTGYGRAANMLNIKGQVAEGGQ